MSYHHLGSQLSSVSLKQRKKEGLKGLAKDDFETTAYKL